MHHEVPCDLNKQVFLLPDYSESGYIVYAPLKGICFWVNNEYGLSLNSFLSSSNDNLEELTDDDLRNRVLYILDAPSKTPNPVEFRIKNHLVLILSELCNFGCKYCYAKSAHCSEVISWQTICRAIDLLFQSTSKSLRVTFIGGGEPLMTYNLMQKTVEYAESLAAKANKSIIFSLTTNASLLSDEHANWLASHNFRVSVSFDILPDVQNHQRPLASGKDSFDYVDRGIKHLIQAGIIPRFRATITSENVQLMVQMVQYTTEYYPQVKSLHFEHVSDSSQLLETYYKDFLENFFQAKHAALLGGIQLSNSITTSFHQLKNIFCEGEFCVVPNGDFVSCHRVSSEKDALYSYFRVGCLNSEQFTVAPIKAGQTLVQQPGECAQCFAKWHCAGGCAYNRLFYNSEQMMLLCNFTKEMIRRELADRLGISPQIDSKGEQYLN